MPQIKISELNTSGALDGSELIAIVKNSQTVRSTTQAIADLASGGGGGGGLSGTNYIFVQANGTPTENATELQTAYNSAKNMNPSGSNIVTIVAAPGYYDFGRDNFIMDTSYINLTSLNGEPDVLLTSNTRESTAEGTIKVEADFVEVIGINTSAGSGASFIIGDNLSNTVIKNCKAGPYSFGSLNTIDPLFPEDNFITSTFIECEADYSFGSVGGSFFGRCLNCKGDFSFGAGDGFANSGTFENCIGSNMGQTGTTGINYGIFIDCYSKGASGFSGNEFYGIYLNIKSDSNMFVASVVSGIFVNCVNLNTNSNASFSGSSQTNSYFINCVSANNSFGYQSQDISDGYFINCIARNGAFGYQAEIIFAEFSNCVGQADCFGYEANIDGDASYPGDVYFVNCTAYNNSFGHNTDAFGFYVNCIGGRGSFGYGISGSLKGWLYNCSYRFWDSGSSETTFKTVTSPGRTINCLGANLILNNQ